MSLFSGKKGIIMGVANGKSIATAVAKCLHDQGATLGFSYLPDESGRMEKRVQQALSEVDIALLEPCNVASDADIATFFDKVAAKFGRIDFLVHSIAFASVEELRKPTIEVSRAGFLEAMNLSVYSLTKIAQHAAALANPGSGFVSMTYYGGEKVIPGYNLMGVCKAALDHTIRYLAFDLGSRQVRVNGISAGPIRTLASSAIGDFKEMLKINEAMTPLARNTSAEDVAQSAAYLMSPMASGVTGEILHVDCGYSIMGGLTPKIKEMIASSTN